jgi:hypothetical protein
MSIAFDGMTRKNDPIFTALSNSTLGRDPGAPVDVTKKDLAEFEKRRDVSSIRASIKVVKSRGIQGRKSLRPLNMKIRNLINTLSSLKLQENREEYFKRVDKLRSLGKPTGTVRQPASHPCPAESTKVQHRYRQQHLRSLAAVRIGGFFRGHTQKLEKLKTGLNGLHQLPEQDLAQYVQILVAYLTYKPSEEFLETKAQTEQDGAFENLVKVEQQDDKRSRCLLGCGSYGNRSALTDHTIRVHVRKGTFESPFWCPECRRLGIKDEDTWIDGGPSAWSNHVERIHGKKHAPNLPTHPCRLPNRQSV